MAKPAKPDNDYRWVICCTDRRGYRGWYGQGESRKPMVMSYLGHAYRYASEADAREAAAHAVGISKFTVEERPERARFKKSANGSEGST